MATPKAETLFIRRIHREMDRISGGPYHEKNNNPFSSGTPDVYYSGSKADLWVEYKFITNLRLSGGMVRTSLTPRQRLWLRQRWAEGRNCRLIVGSYFGHLIIEGPDFNPDVLGADLKASLMSDEDIARWLIQFCGPSAKCSSKQSSDSSGR